MKEQLRLGLTCPIVQEPDASIVVRSDGERLVWVTHHLVDLCWAWRVSGKRGRGLREGKQDWTEAEGAGHFCNWEHATQPSVSS